MRRAAHRLTKRELSDRIDRDCFDDALLRARHGIDAAQVRLASNASRLFSVDAIW
jgi:hypothetical protein